MALHPDPYRAVDRQADPLKMVESLEDRGRTPTQVRLRRRFLAFAGIRPGWKVLEVGSGSGVVCRDVAALVGDSGEVIGVDPSRVFVREARRLARPHGLGSRVRFEVGNGLRLRFRDGTFDATLAVTVLLHVPDADQLLREMIRVTRPGGIVAVQDQDFGTLALDHPDPALTQRLFDGVAKKIYADPWSGRTLPRKLRSLGLESVRLLTDVYQDTAFEPWSRTFLLRRAENAVKWRILSERQAERWLAGIEARAYAKTFLMTLNFYGAVGVKPRERRP
ncbi:MAG: methyltransferase domain-containing protein [Candidatus Rokubacteria bacterium]|nr:methyltransferase domain-containing protein [Candidatus Rokubacteria bacterium]MBI2544129.1 methyltransferase domain-containing protein [Candidatus Rokubacteria bacterium]